VYERARQLQKVLETALTYFHWRPGQGRAASKGAANSAHR